MQNIINKKKEKESKTQLIITVDYILIIQIDNI